MCYADRLTKLGLPSIELHRLYVSTLFTIQ